MYRPGRTPLAVNNDRMDAAVVVGSRDIEGRQWWVVETEERRYHLRPDQFDDGGPRIGLLGDVGYVDGPCTMKQVFITCTSRGQLRGR